MRRQLRQYEAVVGFLTTEERIALHDWVTDGSSVYENGWWITDEGGKPLCFIEAFRLVADMRSHPEDYGLWTEA